MRLRFKILSICIAAAECVGLVNPAAALPFSAGQPAGATLATENSYLTPVQLRVRRDRRNEQRVIRRYNPQRHGLRCRYRNGGCRHYYGGYYYVNPWWMLPPLGGGFYNDPYLYDDPYYDDGYSFYYRETYPGHRRYSRRHIAWCYDHYRSYNQRNNTWISNSGRVRQCISPYM